MARCELLLLRLIGFDIAVDTAYVFLSNYARALADADRALAPSMRAAVQVGFIFLNDRYGVSSYHRPRACARPAQGFHGGGWVACPPLPPLFPPYFPVVFP